MKAASESTRAYGSRDARRAELLDAAVRVMAVTGVAGASTRAITAEAGLAHGAFHYCFGVREELLGALLRQEVEAVVAQLAAAEDPAGAPLGEVVALTLRAELDRVRREPDRQRVLLDLASAVQRIPALADLPAWEHGRYVEETRRRFAAAGLDEERAGRCAALAVAGMQGIIGAWLACRDAGADAAAERAVADLSRAVALLAEDGGR
ncbi:TetR/AcrR family transcriptional regulator [Clavibacter nebraskensis]|uniref:Transcriptional regulator, TetR family n=3 Tax=Clavibacter nebraskensis TaxID=31963 RepID=A0AAI8ZK64_9MICO|nr:TetR/AcrR family transcriptional regulator [Clavibacter nebraskensis]KXU19771.1 TetR family transcriptional regulator [Clavibacter nebraskensis]OAH17826.1 TetR family transcriptional regulator [Clavibacter nebraskensis]QGV67693.1 TetR family transcriptional regulator [Clavibacter nebraskensis]QGV70492.1 TetR family transcriptional regulator [Clavibacter nebraskensis]QGV73283.1 TetR family transcriptional regulator [Clavibacter nebraskensis]